MLLYINLTFLTPDQRAVIAQEVMPMLEEEARKRQQQFKGNQYVAPVEKIPPNQKQDNKSAVKAGKMFNVLENVRLFLFGVYVQIRAGFAVGVFLGLPKQSHDYLLMVLLPE